MLCGFPFQYVYYGTRLVIISVNYMPLDNAIISENWRKGWSQTSDFETSRRSKYAIACLHSQQSQLPRAQCITVSGNNATGRRQDRDRNSRRYAVTKCRVSTV